MIKLQDYTPEVYYKQSRDFQFIGRLYDLILNYSKTNADLLYHLPFDQNSDNQFIELMAYTLGFKQKHNYTSKHLRAVCSVFSEILRNKGSIKAMLLACGAIFHSEGIEQELDYELKNNNTELTLYLPPELKDTTLLNDLFDYILPAGMACNIVKLIILNNDATTKIEVGSTTRLLQNSGTYIYADQDSAQLPIYTTDTTDRKTGKIKISDATNADAADIAGITINSNIYKPGD